MVFIMKQFLLIFLISTSFILVWCTWPTRTETNIPHAQIEQEENIFIDVKYSSNPVNVKWFEYLNTLSSSFIQWAWYDSPSQHMIINLDWVNYQYCGLPSSTRNDFKIASSFWSFYNREIKWNFYCN